MYKMSEIYKYIVKKYRFVIYKNKEGLGNFFFLGIERMDEKDQVKRYVRDRGVLMEFRDRNGSKNFERRDGEELQVGQRVQYRFIILKDF